ncbi:hypothetical protein [Nocardia sp. NPDC024068]|uniref:hypothetical protein n=1 Tax=Nocardia sp. NPDC024068 TaxID=3157197 RepID=UPI0034040C58
MDTGLVDVEVNYTVGLPDPEGDIFARNTAVFKRRNRWSVDNDYRIITRKFDHRFRVLRIHDPRDGFTLSLKEGKIGNLWLTCSAPAARPSDVTSEASVPTAPR